MGEKTTFLKLFTFEPTNHLDMQARQITAKYLNSKRGFIPVSYDRAFCDSAATRMVTL